MRVPPVNAGRRSLSEGRRTRRPFGALVPIVALALAASAHAEGEPTATGGGDIRFSVGTSLRGASLDGRNVQISERLVRGAFGSKLSAWWGEQDLSASGKKNNNRFDGSAVRAGARVVLSGSDGGARSLAATVDSTFGGSGRITRGTSFTTYTPPRVDAITLGYREGDSATTTARTRGFEVGYARVRGGSEQEDVLVGSVVMGRPIARGWSFDVTGTVVAEDGPDRRRALPFIDAGLTCAPVSWARFTVGVSVAPIGLPIAGTPVTGMSRFRLYQGGDLSESLTSRAAALGLVQLSIAHRF